MFEDPESTLEVIECRVRLAQTLLVADRDTEAIDSLREAIVELTDFIEANTQEY